MESVLYRVDLDGELVKTQKNVYVNQNDALPQQPARLVQQQTRQVLGSRRNIHRTLAMDHIFQPIAIESLGSINASGCAFLKNLGRRKVSAQPSDDKKTSFLVLVNYCSDSGFTP